MALSKNSSSASITEGKKMFGDFPPNSKFKCPQNLKSIDSWGTIRQMGNGGKTRIAGFYDKNYVFRVVFLDKKHEFWPTD